MDGAFLASGTVAAVACIGSRTGLSRQDPWPVCRKCSGGIEFYFSLKSESVS